jgi:hypothetical protein
MQQRTKSNTTNNDGGSSSIMDLPQAFPDDTPAKLKVEQRSRLSKSRRTPHDSSSAAAGGNGWMVGFGVLTLLVVVAGYYLVAHHEQVQLAHMREEIVHSQIEPLSREWEERYSNLEEERDRLTSDAQQYISIKDDNERLVAEHAQFTKLRTNMDNQLEYLTKYKTNIQQSIQQMSKTALLEK